MNTGCGEHVCFVDENQCEVRGIVTYKEDFDDRLILTIWLDDNAGYYRATLMKRSKSHEKHR